MARNTKEEKERLAAMLADCEFDLEEAIAFNQAERKILISLSGTGGVSDFSPRCFDRNILLGMNKWDRIRFFYERHRDEIEKDWHLAKDGEVRMLMSWSWDEMDCFGLDFHKELSPPEEIAWDLLKTYRLFMLPQFPVKRYFADFANPFLKIIIEIDGKKWHKDVEKDNARQRDIEGDGWRFVRFPASAVFASKEEAFKKEFSMSFEDAWMLPKDEFMEMRYSLRFKNFEFFCWWLQDEDILTEDNNWLLQF